MTAARHRTGGRDRLGRLTSLGVVLVAVLAALTGIAGTQGDTQAAFTASLADTKNSANTVADYTPTSFPYRDSFAGGMAGWKTYGGCWSTSTAFGWGRMVDTCGGTDGPKAVTGNPAWTDYTLQGDVQVNSGNQAGLLFRVTSPSNGTDALGGYYAAVDRNDNSLFLGRMDNGTYTSLARTSIASGIGLGQFYHLVVQASGCTFTVWQTTVGANTWTSLTYTDPASTCRTSGAIGLRQQGGTAGYRFVTATSGATASTSTSPWNSTLSTGSFGDGSPSTTYGGTWTFAGQQESIADDPHQGVGDKNVLNRQWTDMTMTGDVRLTATPSATSDAGFVVRVSNPSTGLDALQGFYAGISGTQVKLGRQQNGWYDVVTADLPRPVAQGEWWHLTVAVSGCSVVATVAPAAGGTPTQTSTTFANCAATSGAVGLRAKDTTAEWRNTAVTPR